MRGRPSLPRLRALARVIVRHVLIGLLSGGPLAPLARAVCRICPRLRPGGWQRRAELSEPERLRLLFEELGGSFLKLGQMLALQPDLLPPEYHEALYDLLDRVPPVSSEEVQRVIVQELGASPHRIFDHFDPEPIASASIGQVHVAWSQGRKLAVKVQRPTAERDFGGDSRILETLANLIGRLRLERFRFLIEPIREVVEWTRDELDYRREAAFLEAMGRNSEQRPHQAVPRVEAGLSTRRVLTMEFLDGLSLLDFLRAAASGDRITLRRLRALGFDPEIFAVRIIENFLEQAFADGVFHADLHPANLMILPDNTVGYLDLGITGTLGLHSRRQLAAMTLAYTRGDLDSMCRAFGEVSDASEEALERYRQGLERLAEDWYDYSGSQQRLRKTVSGVMLDMLHLSAETGVWAQRDVIQYIRSSVAADGLVARCAPQIDVGRHLGQACRRHLPHLLGGPAPGTGRSLGNWLASTSAGLGQLIRGGRRSAALLDRMGRGEIPPFELELTLPRPATERPVQGSGRRPWRHRPSRPHPSRRWSSMHAALGRTAELALLLIALGLLAPPGSDLLSLSSASAVTGASPLWLLATLPLALPVLRPWLSRGPAETSAGRSERAPRGRFR